MLTDTEKPNYCWYLRKEFDMQNSKHSKTDVGSIILENEILVIIGKESFASQNVIPLDVNREFKNTPVVSTSSDLPCQKENEV